MSDAHNAHEEHTQHQEHTADTSESIHSGAHHSFNMLHPVVQALVHIFEQDKPPHQESQHYQVSRTVSLLAAVYEKARNAVEFRAEHLIRRAAIERIVKRRIVLGGNTNAMAENLIVELLWARYIDSSQVNDGKVQQVQKIIDKYLVLRLGVLTNGYRVQGITWETMLGLLSSEIEETIAPAIKREALNNFYYQAILPRVSIPEEDEKTVNMLTYISIERAFAQSDNPLIMFHLIKFIQPEWLETTANSVDQHVETLFSNIQEIELALHHRLGDSLLRYVRKHNPPFLLLRDFFLEKGDQAKNIIEQEGQLEHELETLAQKRYLETGTKIRRAVVRSIIYIFLTKMVFALALEVPVDMFITRKIDYLAIGINTIFPPILLFVIAGLIKVPGKENTQKLISHIKSILYSFDAQNNEADKFFSQKRERRPVLRPIFSLVYLATFILSFGFISYVLTRLHFNAASQIIFIFFVTLVSFFAYRIRVSAKEYQIDERSGIFSPIVDFFFLPILRVGSMLSNEIAKLNIFMFIFDFILEAPLKVIFDFLEEWFRFIRTKKDEIV